MQNLPWIVALVALTLLALVLGIWGWRGRKPKASPGLPTDWALAARPVFSTDERRVHRLLREALPHHVVLSKLPLVRFCQPTDPGEVRYWYNLLGGSQITFAVCSANGRVLAAIDLDSDRGESHRRMQIKQSVLSACHVRYLRCAVDPLPSVAELQALVPSAVPLSGVPRPAPLTAHSPAPSRDGMGHPLARRPGSAALWQDSSVFQDSFFTPDARPDSFGTSRFPPAPMPRRAAGPLRYPSRRHATEEFRTHGVDKPPFTFPEFDFEQSLDDPEDFAGLIVEAPRFSSSRYPDSPH